MLHEVFIVYLNMSALIVEHDSGKERAQDPLEVVRMLKWTGIKQTTSLETISEYLCFFCSSYNITFKHTPHHHIGFVVVELHRLYSQHCVTTLW